MTGNRGQDSKKVAARKQGRWDRTRVSSETSFVSKQPKLEPKLVSALSETRRLFRLFRINIETNKRPTETTANLLKYKPNSPYHKFSCFGCFDTGPKRRNKPKRETNRKTTYRLSFGLFRFEPKKKLIVSRTPYRESYTALMSSPPSKYREFNTGSSCPLAYSSFTLPFSLNSLLGLKYCNFFFLP
jgi:hypothetical protein